MTLMHADDHGDAWITPVSRIDRGAGGNIARMWFAQHSTPSLPSNPSIERVFDTNKRLTNVRWRTGNNTVADLGDYTYGYANSGQLTSMVNSASGGSSMDTQRFAYDNLGRLTCVAKSFISSTCDTTCTDTVARYQYDDFNNRSSSFFREPSGATHTHVFNYGGVGDRTRLRSWWRSDWGATDTMNIGYGTTPTPGYAPGHRASESRAAAGSDPAMARNWAYYNGGRAALVAMSDARGTGYHYFGYDHLGRQKLSYQFLPDGSARYEVLFYDVFGRMIGSLATNYTTAGTRYEAHPVYWVDNEPVVRLYLESNGGGWSYDGGEYFYNDHTGTPRTTVEFGSNVVRYRASTEPFLAGPPRQDNGYFPMQMRFPGQWEERGTGFVTTGGNALSGPMSALVANHARVYDPGVGAYGQREPMVSLGRWAGGEGVSPWFGYAQHNPVAYVDANGEWATFAMGMLVIGTALAFSSDAQSLNAPVSEGQAMGASMLFGSLTAGIGVAGPFVARTAPTMAAVAKSVWQTARISALLAVGTRGEDCLSGAGRYSRVMPYPTINRLARAAPGTDTVLLGPWERTRMFTLPNGERISGIENVRLNVIEPAAEELGGRTLINFPSNFEGLAREIMNADRIIFFTASRLGPITQREMDLIQSMPELMAKTIFVTGAIP